MSVRRKKDRGTEEGSEGGGNTEGLHKTGGSGARASSKGQAMRPLLGGGLAGNWGRHSLLWLTSGNWMAAHGGPCRAALRLGWPLHGAASRLPIQRLRHRLLLLPHSCGVALSGHQIVKVVQDVVAPAGRGVRFGENGVQTAPVLASLHTAGMLVQTAQHAGGNLAPRSNHGSAAGLTGAAAGAALLVTGAAPAAPRGGGCRTSRAPAVRASKG